MREGRAGCLPVLFPADLAAGFGTGLATDLAVGLVGATGLGAGLPEGRLAGGRGGSGLKLGLQGG